jgi:hypothetical protein
MRRNEMSLRANRVSQASIEAAWRVSDSPHLQLARRYYQHALARIDIASAR